MTTTITVRGLNPQDNLGCGRRRERAVAMHALVRPFIHERREQSQRHAMPPAVRKLRASIRHPNVVGHANAVFGAVAGKSVVAGEALVETTMRVVNQSGLTTAFGTALVALPMREA